MSHFYFYFATYSYAHGPISATEIDGMVKPVLHHYWSKVPNSLTLQSGEDTLTKVFVTSLSIEQEDAWNNFKLAIDMSAEELLSTHKKVCLGKRISYRLCFTVFQCVYKFNAMLA